MKRKKTIVVLGAGASYCYEDGSTNIPIQQDIIERLFFKGTTSSGDGFPSCSFTYGLRHSFELGQYLRQRFSMPEIPNDENGKMGFWKDLQSQGYTLEKLYEELEKDLLGDKRRLLLEFEAIIRTAVSAPTGDRSIDKVCKYHQKLIDALEPGDCIINFNWDCLAADALLYHSPLWFPGTGFGPNLTVPVSNYQKKNFIVDSNIELLHIHGSVLLYELFEKSQRGLAPQYVYLGPSTLNEMGSITALEEDFGGFGLIPDKFFNRLSLGCLYIRRAWYKPIYLPPSRFKKELETEYVHRMRKRIYEHLIYASYIIVIGYSAPFSDLEHLSRLFPNELLGEISVIVVNLDNGNEDYQKRMKKIFHGAKQVVFGETDFKVWVGNISGSN